ncbi:hypothetical protein AVEN_139511-1 [Araneus ventricosus]|uniref:Uncharacterized protein n=1 Tax=Araneus ventricosus TaxID=182803 RepID=A0A4Y2IED3_ARAVE|nr:hypothetical protein AVEN_139511-1 [Araneus ventricosus]
MLRLHEPNTTYSTSLTSSGVQKVFGRKSAPDASGDAEYDREARIVLFGDRADRIAGLETSLEIMFDHINDLQQPVVYPHA